MVGEGVLRNLSLHGGMVESAVLVKPGTAVTLRIYPPTGYPIEVEQGEVRWAKGTQFGVEFVRIRGEDEQQLSELVERLCR